MPGSWGRGSRRGGARSASSARNAREVKAVPVVGAERQLGRSDRPGHGRLVEDRAGLLGAAADVERPAADLAGAAVDDRVRARRPGPRSWPYAGADRAARRGRSRAAAVAPAGDDAAADVLAHQPLHPLAIDRPDEVSAGHRRDYAGAVVGFSRATPRIAFSACESARRWPFGRRAGRR
jgi:hypothetical protein